MNSHEHDHSHHSGNDYERSDANPWLLGGALAVGMVLLGIALVLLNEFFIISKEKLIYERELKPQSTVLREVRAREEQILTTYGVVDSTKGLYRIPIDQAMKLMAEESYTGTKK
jgi:hypothetical protein